MVSVCSDNSTRLSVISPDGDCWAKLCSKEMDSVHAFCPNWMICWSLICFSAQGRLIWERERDRDGVVQFHMESDSQQQVSCWFTWIYLNNDELLRNVVSFQQLLSKTKRDFGFRLFSSIMELLQLWKYKQGSSSQIWFRMKRLQVLTNEI